MKMKHIVLTFVILAVVSSIGCAECFYEGYKAEIVYDCDNCFDEIYSAFQESEYASNLAVSTSNSLKFSEDTRIRELYCDGVSCYIRVFNLEDSGKSQSDADKQSVKEEVDQITKMIEEKLYLTAKRINIKGKEDHAEIFYDCDNCFDEMHSVFQESEYAENLSHSRWDTLYFINSENKEGYISSDFYEESCIVKIYQNEPQSKSKNTHDNQWIKDTVDKVTEIIEENTGLSPNSKKIETDRICYGN